MYVRTPRAHAAQLTGPPTRYIRRLRFLVPSDLSVGQFVYVIRKRLALTADKALFIFIGDTLPPTSMLMREVYALHADALDGFLYVRYSGESTFGKA